MTIPAIDVWMLPATPEVARRAFAAEEVQHVFRGYRRERYLEGVDVSETLGEMDRAGVSAALLTAMLHPQGGITNDDVVALCRAHPGRFFGVCAVDPRRVLPALAELERRIVDERFVALRLEPFMWDMLPTDPRLYPLYARCAQLGVPVCLQIGNTGSRWSSESGRPMHLDRMALDFPELAIVGGHIGWPWTDEAIAVCWKHPNVYIDTSAHLPRNFPPAFVDFMKKGGRSKVMWGTDYPLLGLESARRQVDELGLSDDHARAFLHDTAVRVFKLPLKTGS